MIGEYLCYKAVGNLKDVVGPKGDNGKGRSYEAWFTPSIPSKVGPPFYYNLPGLVLFGTDQNGVSYLVQKIKQEKPGSVVLEKMPDIRHVSHTDYVEQMVLFIKEHSR
jgi:GLPGLI family protein